MSEPKPRFGSGCCVSANASAVPDGCMTGVDGALWSGSFTSLPMARTESSSADSPPGLARMKLAFVPTPGSTDGFAVPPPRPGSNGSCDGLARPRGTIAQATADRGGGPREVLDRAHERGVRPGERRDRERLAGVRMHLLGQDARG